MIYKFLYLLVEGTVCAVLAVKPHMYPILWGFPIFHYQCEMGPCCLPWRMLDTDELLIINVKWVLPYYLGACLTQLHFPPMNICGNFLLQVSAEFLHEFTVDVMF